MFAKDGTLVRTLWSGVSLNAGAYTKYWDGLDDKGQTAANATYDIRLISNNVSYTWEGVIGNSSFGNSQGNGLQRAFIRTKGMAIAGDYAYYGAGYAEGNPSQARFALSNPQQRLDFFPKGSTDQATLFVATDGKLVYWAGYDGYDNGNKWFVFATRTADNGEQSFANGQALKMAMGRTYASAIDVINGAAGVVTGMAVQKNGKYLFVSHKSRHQIRVLDKTTGNLVQSLFFNDAAGLSVDGQDNLWIINGNTVSRFTVNNDGTLSNATLSLSGLNSPMALAVSPDNQTVVVADGGDSQQVKAYSNSTGASVWTLGQAGGYRTDPTVANDKFYFSDASGGINDTFVAFAPDGSFWVGDSGNYRVQHYSAGRSYIDRIMYLQNNYSSFIDQNNPNRLFAEFLEFAVDYSKPLGGTNGSWTLVKNWRAAMPANYFESLTINHTYITNIFRDVLTLSNGRVYGFLRRFNDNKWVLAELPANGPLRITKIAFDAQNRYTYHIASDGSLRQSANNINGTSGSVVWESRRLTGFDADNDPVWAPATSYASAPVNSGGEPINWYGGQSRTGETTSSGVVVSFDEGKINGPTGAGYHLGGLRVGDNKWLWKTAMATTAAYKGPYPNDGAYDVGNGVEYGGGGIAVLDRSIFWNYHGEFWKGSQVNKWQHVYDNGLLLGIFGKTGPEVRIEAPDGRPVAGMAGNVYFGTAVRASNGVTYLYHGEESGWGGIHRWRIDNMQSIQEQVIGLKSLDSYAVSTTTPGTEGIDLLSGLSPSSVLQDGTAGWNRNPAAENTAGADNKWTAKTSIMSYDRFASPDLYVNFSKASTQYTVTRDLGNNTNLGSWSLQGVISFDNTNPNNGTPGQSDSGGSYFEVLDNAGKVLARLYNQVFFDQAGTPVKTMGNGQQIAQGYYFDPASAVGSAADAINISLSNGSLTIKYRDYPAVTTGALEAGGNLQNPRTVRLFFWCNGRNYERTIDIQQLRFITGVTTASVAPTPTPTPTTPTFATSGKVYTIKAKQSAKFIDVSGQSVADGESIIQWTYNGGKNQQWKLTQATGSYFTFQSVNSGKVLDIVSASTADGAKVNQWSANGQTNQQFKLVDAGSGYVNIVVNNSQKCLDITNQSTADGAAIVQNTCGGSDSQKFLLSEIASGSGRLSAVDIQPEAGFNLFAYPNPATDLITITGAKDQLVTFTDLTGHTLLEVTCVSDAEQVSVQSLPMGSYIVRRHSALNPVSQKLLIVR
ncbi:RICIN domain-containing protein [Spirosoma rhododendri]|uniref:RICIN domain-containing protein n=1 Tax=Spirosoma rhododendri TaxID=2728024 RepID=UPI0020C57F81|nr:RICIN domain-containing protein [Spirosoma rhododendri]